MTDLLSTKNTLNITYNYDETNQRSGYFTLDLRQDNKTYVPKQLNTDSVTYYKEGSYEIKTWPAKLTNGKIVLQATDFPDLRKSGTYVIRATVDGIIFPSQGKCTLTLNGDFSSDTPIETQVIAGHDGADGASVTNVNVDENGLMTVTLDDGKTFTSQIRMPKAVKGDRGDKGSDGLSAYQLAQQAGFKGSLEEWLQSLKGKAAEITNASITGKTLTFKLSDNSSYSVELPLLKGDKGDNGLPGKDAPTINNATIDGNTLTFDLSDGTKHSVVLPLLKGDRGEAGLNGKDAPKITNVTLNGNALTFDLSDSSRYSVNLPLLRGERGEAGQAGKDAPKITGVTLNDNNLTFALSDNSSYSLVLPLLKGDRGEKGLSAYQIAQQAGFSGTETDWLQSLKGVKGDNGLPGKDAPKITGVTLNSDQTQIIFTMSDGTNLESSFKAPTAIPGKDGKDAPKITSVSYKDNQLVFTLSDKSAISANLPDLTGPAGQKGSDGLSAYQIAVSKGFKGSEQDWLNSLKGAKGDTGIAGQNAPKITGVTFGNNQLTFTLSDKTTISTPLTLPKGDKGNDGKDAPKITGVTLNGNTLTFNLSDSTSFNVTLPLLKGDKGDRGSDGLSAYQIAVSKGFKGSEQDWLNSLKGETGPAGKDGTGTKLKGVFYDSIRKKAVFLNDDNTSIESSIFSDTNLPANPNNLTDAYLTPDPNQKPSPLLPGKTDLKIPISFNMNKDSPATTACSLDNIDLHLNTYPLVSTLVNSLYLNSLQSVKDNAYNLRFNLQSACLSDDKHTLYAIVSPYPFSDGVKIYQPVFNFYDEPWHTQGLTFNSLIGFDHNTDGKTTIVSLSSDTYNLFGSYNSFTFLNTLGLNLIVFHSDSFTPTINKHNFTTWTLDSGVITPINVDFTVR